MHKNDTSWIIWSILLKLRDSDIDRNIWQVQTSWSYKLVDHILCPTPAILSPSLLCFEQCQLFSFYTAYECPYNMTNWLIYVENCSFLDAGIYKKFINHLDRWQTSCSILHASNPPSSSTTKRWSAEIANSTRFLLKAEIPFRVSPSPPPNLQSAGIRINERQRNLSRRWQVKGL